MSFVKPLQAIHIMKDDRGGTEIKPMLHNVSLFFSLLSSHSKSMDFLRFSILRQKVIHFAIQINGATKLRLSTWNK